jgi:hypothetical protein
MVVFFPFLWLKLFWSRLLSPAIERSIIISIHKHNWEVRWLSVWWVVVKNTHTHTHTHRAAELRALHLLGKCFYHNPSVPCTHFLDSLTVLPGLALDSNSPTSTSQVAGIADVNHYNWLAVFLAVDKIYARHCFKYFACINVIHFYLRLFEVCMIFLFYRWENWVTEWFFWLMTSEFRVKLSHPREPWTIQKVYSIFVKWC